MKMDEFKKNILKLKIDRLRVIADVAEWEIAQIRDAKERGYSQEMLTPYIFKLGESLGELNFFDLPEWCKRYKSYALFIEYKYRVIDKIKDFYYHEL